MSQAGINFARYYPDQFLAYLRAINIPVYHKSNIFFRDFQFGLWKFMHESQTKVSYADMEKVARELAESYAEQGIFRKINRQAFELNMPSFAAAGPATAAAAAPPKGKPAPAVAAAAAPAAGATAGGGSSAAGTTLADSVAAASAAAAMSTEDKAAKIAEVQRKMAEAKARRLAGG
jgi:hypothetical protein